jgi:Na+-translocating ferredoxin:NAD+ oxidoreductase RnfG subunit
MAKKELQTSQRTAIYKRGHGGALSLLMSFVFVCSPLFGRTHTEQATLLLQKHFSYHTRISDIALALSPSESDSLQTKTKQRFPHDTLHLLLALNSEKTVGYAIVDDVKGKDQLITYCIIVDESLVVKEVRILAYREPYGGEVQNESWLRQFFGRRPNDELRPGKEIRNITGATISSRAITLGVKRILSLLRIVQSRLTHTANTSR